MSMIIKSVSSLNGVEILAEPILTNEKEILIPKGTILKKEYISLIQSLGYETLMIEDPYESLEEPNFIIDREKFDSFVARVRKLMEAHIYHGQTSLREFEIIANDLIKEINQNNAELAIDMNERSANLYEHSVMVALLSLLVAKKLHLDQKKLFNIAVGALLHDIGIRYITVPYENSDWRLLETAEVFEFKKHTILGFSALEEESWIPQISRKMVLSHHEKMDGSGFPMKQKNKEIEIKIIQVCDTFDCYISGMECKRISVQEALERITEQSDVLYEKKIVDHLLATLAKYPVGTTVTTNEKKQGVVVSQTKDPQNPIILIIDVEPENKLNLMLEENISILGVI